MDELFEIAAFSFINVTTKNDLKKITIETSERNHLLETTINQFQVKTVFFLNRNIK